MNFKKITPKKARDYWLSGYQIYLVPSNVSPSLDNPWISPCFVTPKGSDDTIHDFEHQVLSFHYYNCNHEETGKLIHYYCLELKDHFLLKS